MATNVDRLVAELRGFRDRKAVLAAMRKGIRAGVPPVRKAIRARALATLPHRGGLARWVAAGRINLKVKASSASAGVTLIGGRNSQGGRTDMRAIDAGRVRAPSWGRRTSAAWHVQAVRPGFFTEPAAGSTSWHNEVDAAVDHALNTLRAG
jgi:hypothetical protein